MANSTLEDLVPQFVRTNRNLSQFWQFIKYKFKHYAERRDFIWGEFNPLLDALERSTIAPSDGAVFAVLERFDAAHVQAAWSKALDRRSTDPEGAITSPQHAHLSNQSASIFSMRLAPNI